MKQYCENCQRGFSDDYRFCPDCARPLATLIASHSADYIATEKSQIQHVLARKPITTGKFKPKSTESISNLKRKRKLEPNFKKRNGLIFGIIVGTSLVIAGVLLYRTYWNNNESNTSIKSSEIAEQAKKSQSSNQEDKLCVDCEDQDAGHEWAETNGIEDVDYCGGKNPSFIKGCRSFAKERMLENCESDIECDQAQSISLNQVQKSDSESLECTLSGDTFMAGFEWAMSLEIEDVDYCAGKTKFFVEGCRSFAKARMIENCNAESECKSVWTLRTNLGSDKESAKSRCLDSFDTWLAGYKWAEVNKIKVVSSCRGRTKSFNEGCSDYLQLQ